MTREDAKQLLPIIQAFAEGKCVETKTGSGWVNMENMSFAGKPKAYRIHPEPKYRPFANAEECFAEMLNDHPFGWLKDKKDGHYVLITGVDDDTCGMSLNGNAAWSLSGIMDLFTFSDGTPFGILEED